MHGDIKKPSDIQMRYAPRPRPPYRGPGTPTATTAVMSAPARCRRHHPRLAYSKILSEEQKGRGRTLAMRSNHFAGNGIALEPVLTDNDNCYKSGSAATHSPARTPPTPDCPYRPRTQRRASAQPLRSALLTPSTTVTATPRCKEPPGAAQADPLPRAWLKRHPLG